MKAAGRCSLNISGFSLRGSDRIWTLHGINLTLGILRRPASRVTKLARHQRCCWYCTSSYFRLRNYFLLRNRFLITLLHLTLFSITFLIFNIIAVLDFVDHFAQNRHWWLANFVTREPAQATKPCSGLHSHNLRLLNHCSVLSPLCSCSKAEIDFSEVSFPLRVWWYWMIPFVGDETAEVKSMNPSVHQVEVWLAIIKPRPQETRFVHCRCSGCTSRLRLLLRHLAPSNRARARSNL